ncbi:MAG: ABC transporter substrate-binding protein [Candidatus Rokuibacteriota bacterium]|nr:MAG: ABC transporter substrate-binding protein [Candidatus Rokubacteria bacterium]
MKAEMTRRQFVGTGAAATAALAVRVPVVHAQKREGTLRFVAQADLKILDPVWTTAYITRNHSYLVYDTLFGTDDKLQIKPQMVDRHTVSRDGMKYSFTLRDGLKWHDGQAVVAEDCVESLKRWGKKDRFGRLLMAHTAKIAPIDKKTFTLDLAERFGPVLEALGKPSSNVPFMMPARVAATSADEQIKEIVGSGPFKFVKDEWQPGNQVVYVKHADYVPRNEAPSGSTGGKKVYVDRVLWRYIPDPATANAALAAGEVDWWEQPPLDFIPKIEQTASLSTFLTDPLGTQGWLRPNHLHPPFNNKKARQALLSMVDQPTYLQAAIGPAKYYRTCQSVFACNGPYATKVGADALAKQDLARARQLVKESGYDGRPVAVIHVTDIPLLNGAALVTRELLQSIGFTVDLRAMDWSTNLATRARKEPPDKGGWNVLHTWWMAADVISPAVHFGVSGAGAGAWFGWPDIPQLEKLITEWVRATDQGKRKQLADEIQKVALDEVAYVPWGEYVQPTAFRKSVQGILKFIAPLFWNVKIA